MQPARLLPHASTARKSTIRCRSVLWSPCFRSRSRPCKIPQPPQRWTAPLPLPTVQAACWVGEQRNVPCRQTLGGDRNSPCTHVHMHICRGTCSSRCSMIGIWAIAESRMRGVFLCWTPGETDGCLLILPGTAAHWIS